MRKNVFPFYFPSAGDMVLLPREARPCLSERKKHFSPSARGTTVPLENRKKACFLFVFFPERHGFASARGTAMPLEKKNMYSFFFLRREAWFCFPKRHGCASQKRKKINIFSFLSREARVYFSWRHKFVSVRGTIVPLSEREKMCSRPVFFMKKISSKSINMGSNFEDLDVSNPAMKHMV
jgi:hypothetical protein